MDGRNDDESYFAWTDNAQMPLPCLSLMFKSTTYPLTIGRVQFVNAPFAPCGIRRYPVDARAVIVDGSGFRRCVNGLGGRYYWMAKSDNVQMPTYVILSPSQI